MKNILKTKCIYCSTSRYKLVSLVLSPTILFVNGIFIDISILYFWWVSQPFVSLFLQLTRFVPKIFNFTEYFIFSVVSTAVAHCLRFSPSKGILSIVCLLLFLTTFRLYGYLFLTLVPEVSMFMCFIPICTVFFFSSNNLCKFLWCPLFRLWHGRLPLLSMYMHTHVDSKPWERLL